MLTAFGRGRGDKMEAGKEMGRDAFAGSFVRLDKFGECTDGERGAREKRRGRIADAIPVPP